MMKLIILTIATIGMMSFTFLQDNDIPAKDVPEEVKSNFNKAFPDAMDIEWEKKRGNYEVDFEVENTDFSARFNANGSKIMSKQDIQVSELPDAVTAAIQKEYEGYHIDDAEKVKKDGKVFYQVELDGKLMDREKVFAEDGKLDNSFDYWD